ncbi:MAG: hypothetical protein JXB36_05020 [Gammaproteobacteria bacterium]|nr:hypothetical protein [Gammaproteobacteria bacterium]
MATAIPDHAPTNDSSPVSIDSGAVAHLRYIRDTMEAAHTFTSVPGKGCIAMGITALVAAVLDSVPGLAPYWLPIWLTAAVTAVLLASFFLVRKARAQGLGLWRGVARRFFLTLLPALLAGAVLTTALIDSDARELVAGAWLLLYGAGLAASGVFSIGPVMVTGFAFMVLGTLALMVPPSWSTALLAVGFGGLHLVLGTIISRRHGG